MRGDGFGSFVLRRVPQDFRPVWWAPTALMQSALAAVVHRTPRVHKTVQEYGGGLVVEWMPHDPARVDAVVLFFPGVGDGANVVDRMMHTVWSRLPRTQCGMVVYPADCLGSAACAMDLSPLFEHGETPIVVVCACMGSGVFTNWAARSRPCKVTSALVLAHGHSLVSSIRSIDAYRLLPFLPLSKYLLPMWHRLRPELRHVHSFEAWDAATYPGEYEAMIRECDAAQVMHTYDVPSLFVNATDDFVCPAWRMVGEVYERPHHARLKTAGGGHLGWIGGRDWVDRLVVAFVTASLEWTRERLTMQT